MNPFRYPATGTIWSGAGSLEQLGDALDELEVTRPLAVITPAISRDAALMARLRAATGGRLNRVFDGLEAHAPYNVVLAAADIGEQAGVDGVISIGGGTAIDTGRLAALCLADGVRTTARLHDLRVEMTPDGPRFPLASARALPHIAVPTTLSSSEFSDGGAATCPWTGRKELFAGPSLACRAVIVDPLLACSTPPEIWAMTGVRALDHAIETILSPRSSALTDALSLAAIGYLREALPAALDVPNDPDVRRRGQLGSWLSYFGVSGGTLGLSHAIGHQMGSRLGIAHGHASCIALPEVMLFVAPHARGKARLVAEAFDVDEPGASEAVVARRASAAVATLIGDLGMPRRLSQLGVGSFDTEELADAVLGDFLAGGAPGGLPPRDDLAALIGGLG